MNGLILVVLLAVACQASNIGIAVVRGTIYEPTISGTVIFTTDANTSLVHVQVQLTGITNNATVRGIHVHYWGDLLSNDGNSAGAHYNPRNQQHGCYPNVSRHNGDMGNWDVINGTINENKTFDLLSLQGVESIIGRSVVVHNFTDDCTNITTNGNSGVRSAYGVIGIYQDAANTAAQGATPSVTGEDQAVCVLQSLQGSGVGGYAIVKQAAGETSPRLFVTLTGVTSVHAIHIHAYGDLRTNLTVGGHWALDGNVHGVPGTPQYHTGDLGNVYTLQSPSYGLFNFTNSTVFDVLGDRSLIGHALVVHANRDDCSSPIGNSGARVAFCVFGITDGVYFNRTTPAFPPSISVPNIPDLTTILDCARAFNISLTTGTTVTNTTSVATTTSQNDNSSSSIFVSFALMVLALLF